MIKKIRICKIGIEKEKNSQKGELKIKKKIPWRRPIFALTIVGAEELNFCVRDGNRCTLFAIVTKEFFI